jgi:hypothetical protein
MLPRGFPLAIAMAITMIRSNLTCTLLPLGVTNLSCGAGILARDDGATGALARPAEERSRWSRGSPQASSPWSCAPSYLRRHTIERPVLLAEGYNAGVKPYRIERIQGSIRFTCTHCEHSVSTLDFDPKAGNLRTQAATAINRHATQAHHEPPTVSSLDDQLRPWRS